MPHPLRSVCTVVMSAVFKRAVGWLGCLLLSSWSSAPAEPLAWPLSIGPALSSSFGESRSASFHMGIDFKTGGRTGYEVRAVDEGYIVRVRTSPWGYGRAVYQRLVDGRTAVYAHLSAFVGPARERVEVAQRTAQRYSVDLWFKPEEIPVQRGDVIALSGESGAGPPHLHFELRDEDNRPINPLLKDYAVDDTTPPVMRRIGLVSRDGTSRINGRNATASFALRWSEEEEAFVAADTVHIRGPIGVAVQVWDRADAANNKLAPHQLSMWINGWDVASISYDQISYANGHQVHLDRIYIDYPGGRGRFHTLFKPAGSRLGFYHMSGDGLMRASDGAGAGALGEGVHDMEVMASDRFGNRSRARMAVRVNDVPTFRAAAVKQVSGRWMLEAEVADQDDVLLDGVLYRWQQNRWERLSESRLAVGQHLNWDGGARDALWKMEVRDAKGALDSLLLSAPVSTTAKTRLRLERTVHGSWVALRLLSDAPVSQQPKVLMANAVFWPRQVAAQVYEFVLPLGSIDDDGGAEAVAVLRDERWPVKLAGVAVRPGQARRVELANGNVALDFAANSVYEMIFPQVESFIPEPSENLAAIEVGYDLGPSGIPFDGRVGVWLRCPPRLSEDSQIGLYREVRAGQWALVGNEREGNYIGSALRRFGRFALMRDGQPPQVDNLHPRSSAQTRERRPELRARIRDAGSGIGREEDIQVELNGQRLVAEYDPEANMVRALPYEDLPLGAHQWTVSVRDMGGNERRVNRTFSVVK